ncbi:hypothetical protein E2C01_074726 [Portunus trituberculatus]|uniref:Uncharacterized protein n=1 Tax=Portunus trituberculatus TaxID=210409 RepID=A0A5B7IH06_PORTR|nr:hypothetical protein [Portunus trituberculatus]
MQISRHVKAVVPRPNEPTLLISGGTGTVTACIDSRKATLNTSQKYYPFDVALALFSRRLSWRQCEPRVCGACSPPSPHPPSDSRCFSRLCSSSGRLEPISKLQREEEGS